MRLLLDTHVLIAQASAGFTLVTRDDRFEPYGVALLRT